MKITIKNTDRIVTVNGVPARVWTGQTESGVPVHCYITRIGVPEGRPAEDYAQFERELKAQPAPTPQELKAIPLHLIF